MLFFFLAENTNFSVQSHGVAEGTEFTISLFTIMALTFQGNELGGKEHHWVPSDKLAGLAAAANYLAGRKGCVPGIRRRVCELWRMGKVLWCLCHANWRMAPQGHVWPLPLFHYWADIFANYDPKHTEKYPWPLTVCKGEAMPLE